jgi:hypothetical protein
VKVKNPKAPDSEAGGRGGLGFATLDKVKKPKPPAVTARRFPPPWTAEKTAASRPSDIVPDIKRLA